jgi:hypothetical protein
VARGSHWTRIAALEARIPAPKECVLVVWNIMDPNPIEGGPPIEAFTGDREAAIAEALAAMERHGRNRRLILGPGPDIHVRVV